MRYNHKFSQRIIIFGLPRNKKYLLISPSQKKPQPANINNVFLYGLKIVPNNSNKKQKSKNEKQLKKQKGKLPNKYKTNTIYMLTAI